VTPSTAVPGSRDADAVMAVVEAALREARSRDRKDLVARLDAEHRRAQRGSCAVLVVGEFNKGKSSLVNALLNARVCATDADVATAVPTLVEYGDRLSASSGGADAGVGTAIDPADLEELQTADEPTARATGVVRVTVPRALLRSGMVLVDTPGVGGGLASAHAARTLRALTGADAVVFVTDASQEMTAAELDLLRRIVDLCPRVLCALTKTDVYAEWRRIRDLDRGHLARAGLDVPVLPLSSALRQHGLRTGDRELVAESGYPQLAAFLRETSAGAGRRALAAAAAAAQSALTQLLSLMATERQALAEPDRRRQQAEAVLMAQRRAEQLKGGGSRWLQLLNDRIGDLASAVDFDLGVRLRGIRREIGDKLATTDPTRDWVEIEPWLYEQTNIALADHLRMLRDQADEIADEVARRFGDEAWRLRAETDITSVTSAETAITGDIGLAALAVSRASRMELGIAAVRGGSTGAVIANAAGYLLAGAAGIAFLPAVVPVTAVLAGLLGRSTWRTARQSQLRALRAEAERAVAVYLDGVELRARRDSRDSVRRVHQHLRDVFSAHAVELQSSVQRNLEVVATEVQADERSRRERVRRADLELERLRSLAARAETLVDEFLGAPVPAGAA
jgi:GTP-binding protein EngB required for normal cell division